MSTRSWPLRTASDSALADPNFGYVNWALGLAGEAGEVLELLRDGSYSPTTFAFAFNPDDKGIEPKVDLEVLTKELGDVMWYIALLCEQAGFDLDEFANMARDYISPHISLTIAACNTADYIKKVVCHGHDLDTQKLRLLVGACFGHTRLCCHQTGISLSDVLEANIEKLRLRYPEGFSTEASINRKENQ